MDALSFALLCFTSFFTLINPLGIMPVFMTMTAPLTHAQRTHTAKKAIIVAFCAMVGFAFSGDLLFNFFGISVHSFRVVGGIIFFMMGFEMLQAKLSRVKVDEDQTKEYVNDISITPLAIPMLCGPGVITTSIVLMQDAQTIEFKGILLGTMAFICLLTFLVLWSSTKLIKLLGDTGNKVMMRLMGLIIMVVAVEFLFSGLKPMIQEMLKIN